MTVFAIAKSLGLITAIIQDAGRTQIEAGNKYKTFKEAIYFQKNIFSFQKFSFSFFFSFLGSKTVVAIGPGPEEQIDQVTRHLGLL